MVRQVDDFDQVLLAGEGGATIVVGEEVSVMVETDDNLLDLIETAVRGGVLEISTSPGIDIAPSDSVTYRIAIPQLLSVAISGVGTIDIDRWSTERAVVQLIGAGSITIAALDSDTLDVEHYGVGSIIVGGATADQTVRALGVGEYDASDLESGAASVDARGPSATTLWVTGTLDVTASDASSVSYFGSPEVTQQIDDLASVTSLGER